jgi:hypothetical protein
LVQAIDDLLAAARFSICTPCTEQNYASLVQLHGTVKGLAAVLGLGSPPALEDAALAVHRQTPAGPFVPVRGINSSPPAPWEQLMLSLRAAAEVARGVVERASVRGDPAATDAGEKWMPASEAVEFANEKGYDITVGWISKRKDRLRTRPRQLPGNHQLEVEIGSLGRVLFNERTRKAVTTDTEEPDERQRDEFEARKKAEQARKRRPLD